MIVARAVVLISFTLAAIVLSMLLFASPYDLRVERPARPRPPHPPPADPEPHVVLARNGGADDPAAATAVARRPPVHSRSA